MEVLTQVASCVCACVSLFYSRGQQRSSIWTAQPCDRNRGKAHYKWDNMAMSSGMVLFCRLSASLGTALRHGRGKTLTARRWYITPSAGNSE